ncbi:MBL fold metallo-hydrolase [Ohtaekwangia koreensis]|uniref:3',5'-cyclic-nucleotide phosphodiesterase n=1 Tax=Ohtaekwangia koreensis TaxID=688867 RepID=A0A1T5MK47_9BACT|nr:3',5'-cyclic-nucleotide phosphodiesterase [Ohtaekwangia koreensis]SKC88597.1 3',5'-cyclic-nucleotide phosphodiesterase [Ohtaekwangia koreensis]
MIHRTIYLTAIFAVYAFTVLSQATFQVIPLGVKGGSDESNLSSYLVGVKGTTDYVCLDAGTIHAGLQRVVDRGLVKGTPSEIQRSMIKGYLLSHPHLDHVAGLIINSPEDSPKPIYGLPFCLDVIKEKYFSWKSWANFGNEGEKPTLNKYQYTALSTGNEIPLAQTSMSVKAFALSHAAPGQSTAFLIRQNNNYILYLGDTGADTIEHSQNLHLLWRQVGPLIKAKQLKAIFIEVSFPNEQPDKLLFGHLTPRLLMNELNILNSYSNHSLKGFSIVITHIKPVADNETKIKKQLSELNALQVKLVYPEQGIPLEF